MNYNQIIMPEKKQEKPKMPEVKNEQTILYKFGSMISGILASVLGSGVKVDKKPEVKSEKHKEGK
jgi:ADP-glucose pyrophosphorylase